MHENIGSHDSMVDSDSVNDTTTLMQKWRAHWNTRDRIFNPPPETANKLGVSLFWTSNIVLMYTTLYVTAARDDVLAFGISCYWWRVVAWFLWFQTSYNWFLASLKVEWRSSCHISNGISGHWSEASQFSVGKVRCHSLQSIRPAEKNSADARCILRLISADLCNLTLA